jgi:uncharacterized membrane protein YhaH (DUF805 family)
VSRPIYWAVLAAIYSLNLAMYFQLIGMRDEDFESLLPLLILLGGAVTLYINLAVSVKRLHDFAYRGFLAIVIVIPLVNLIFAVWPGTPGPNAFGAVADRPPA